MRNPFFIKLKKVLDKGYNLKEGVKQGIKEGSKQTQNEIAKNLLQAKVSEEIIIETTGITKEELDKLKN